MHQQRQLELNHRASRILALMGVGLEDRLSRGTCLSLARGGEASGGAEGRKQELMETFSILSSKRAGLVCLFCCVWGLFMAQLLFSVWGRKQRLGYRTWCPRAPSGGRGGRINKFISGGKRWDRAVERMFCQEREACLLKPSQRGLLGWTGSRVGFSLWRGGEGAQAVLGSRQFKSGSDSFLLWDLGHVN